MNLKAANDNYSPDSIATYEVIKREIREYADYVKQEFAKQGHTMNQYSYDVLRIHSASIAVWISDRHLLQIISTKSSSHA